MSANEIDFEPVIGLEVHVQLATRSKLFCACANAFGAPPNSHICPTCTGQPGALPAPNKEALILAIRAGIALECTIARVTSFDRKNYFYPDLPKGYQITQLERPIVGAGGFEIVGDDGVVRRIPIVRAHLEEDAGKTMHLADREDSLVDCNRAGVPLLEIVSGPDLRSPAEAHRYLTELRSRLRYARVSECDMEKGTLRCDANVSLRARGTRKFGTRVEIKNLNSFRNVEAALSHEIERQSALLRAGGTVDMETRSFDADAVRTRTLRKKEEAEDYRYFRDPDLPEYGVDDATISAIRAAMPESQAAKAERYASTLQLEPPVVTSLCQERDVAEYFDRAASESSAATPAYARSLANFVLGPVLGLANARGESIAEFALAPERLAALVRLVESGALSGHAARSKVLEDMVASGRGATESVRFLGLEQVSDTSALDGFIDAALAANPKAVAEYQAGKSAALNSLVGAVMKASQGKANPNLVRDRLTLRLAVT